MVDRERVTQLLDELRPSLQSHGGDVQFVDVTEDGVVKVVLEGACKGCPMAAMTVKEGIEARLKEEIPEITEVVPVEAE
ncbi:MAG: NifU family protein [Candidatus Brocadiia bacterium]|jgi:Fe-S cluster biogenesis protein NfuA|nr:NifU family protein [Candidatus Brocadiia bacterium]